MGLTKGVQITMESVDTMFRSDLDGHLFLRLILHSSDQIVGLQNDLSSGKVPDAALITWVVCLVNLVDAYA